MPKRYRRRVQPHPQHLTPADRPGWKSRQEALEADIASGSVQALTRPCGTCGAPEGQPCESLDGTPHAARLEVTGA